MTKEPSHPGFDSASVRTYQRDEQVTGFTAILARMLAAAPGSVGAAIVDGDGEAVDYAGDHIDPFDLKVAAAHWRIVLAQIEGGRFTRLGGPVHRLVVHTSRRVFILDALPDGYALLSILRAGAAFGHVDRALETAVRELYAEAGWTSPPDLSRWWQVEVRSEDGRPCALRFQHWVPVEVIGRVAAGLAVGQTGFRVSLGPREAMLIHARDARWYIDLPPGELSADKPKKAPPTT